MPDQTVEIMETHELNLAAFAIARGATMDAWNLSNGQATFSITGRADDHRAAFFARERNVNIQEFINARNMLLDMIKHKR